jgi:hypothetical protein
MINSVYSEIEASQVGKSLDAHTRSTRCVINHVLPSFESIKINTRYGDYTIGIDSSASYLLNGKINYGRIIGRITYPESGHVNTSPRRFCIRSNGHVGINPDPSASVQVVAKCASVILDK